MLRDDNVHRLGSARGGLRSLVVDGVLAQLNTALATRRVEGEEITTITWEITPELAAEILKSRSEDRGISRVTVSKYARDMRAGTFTLTDQGINLDPEGCRGNGQHRLTAVVETGLTVKMRVSRYWSWDAFRAAKPNIDKGFRRTPGNTLEYAGMVRPGKGRDLAKILVAIAKVDSRIPVSPTSTELLSAYELYGTAARAVVGCRELNAPVLAAFAIAWRRKDARAAVKQCLDEVISKAATRGSAAQALLRHLKELQENKLQAPDRRECTQRVLNLLHKEVTGGRMPGLVSRGRVLVDEAACRYFLGDNYRRSEP